MSNIIEQPNSGVIDVTRNSSTITYKYKLTGYVSETAAWNALAAYAPSTATVDGVDLTRDKVSIQPITATGNTGNLSHSIYTGTVTLSRPSNSGATKPEDEAANDSEAIFETEFNTREGELFYAFDQINVQWNNDWYAGNPHWQTHEFGDTQTANGVDEPAKPKWLGNAIGKSDSTSAVKGVSVQAPTATFTLKVLKDPTNVSNNWFKDRMNQLYTLNSATFRSLEPRSVALVGMRSAQLLSGMWSIDYTFEYRPFIENYRLSRNYDNGTTEEARFYYPQNTDGTTDTTSPLYNGTTNSFRMSAWDYLWVRTTDKTIDKDEDTNLDIYTTQLTGFSISQVYKSSNFTNLF